MNARGQLRKMRVELAEPVRYRLALDDASIEMSALVGQPIELRFSGTIHCTLCGRRTDKSFGDGLCYPCFRDAPEASPCIIRPELCEGHLGRGRDTGWEQRHHVQPHFVYLAITSGLKVGVTRDLQVPTRWIDQGAWRAIKLSRTPNRFVAGRIEVALKQHVSDRTQWQRMLKNIHPLDLDLPAEKERLNALLPGDLQGYRCADDEVVELHYPVRDYPTRVKSINLGKSPLVDGTLWGIKGQYLIMHDGRVLNVRRHAGYQIELSY